ncbi:MAG: hypothetical protein V1736_03235 [Pseudomonadota bacterium]
MGAFGDVRSGTIPSLLPSQKHYLEVYSPLKGRHKPSPIACTFFRKRGFTI